MLILCVLRFKQDIVLFEALLSDLFPDTQPPPSGDEQLQTALEAACRASGLQPEPAFVGKALQLSDTLGVRFGVMLIGPAGELWSLTGFVWNTKMAAVVWQQLLGHLDGLKVHTLMVHADTT